VRLLPKNSPAVGFGYRAKGGKKWANWFRNITGNFGSISKKNTALAKKVNLKEKIGY
jgi:hypothetical protein